jgi:hypothetical protein
LGNTPLAQKRTALLESALRAFRNSERQKDRKTERQKDRKTERQKDRKTRRHEYRNSASSRPFLIN